MGLDTVASASELLHGALGCVEVWDGWVRPERFTPAQLRALGSCRAWHPGLFRQLAACSAGVSVCFETDATRVEVELVREGLPRGSAAVLADVASHEGRADEPLDAAAYDHVCADVDERHLAPLEPDGRGVVALELDDPARAPEPGLVRLPLPGMGEPHRVRLWLPCLSPSLVRSVRCDGSYLRPVAEKDALLVLGDSISQGYVAQDPARSWTALLAEHLGLDLLNQGVGGQVFQPGSLADLARAVTPAAIVVAFGANYRYEPCQASRVGPEIRAYLAEVAAAWPEVPTWVVTPLPSSEELYPTHPASCFSEVAALIARAAARWPQMRLVDGAALLDEDRLGELCADGADHPGAAGQRLLFERLSFAVDATADAPELRRARALELAAHGGDVAFPLAEALRRGIGEVLLAERGIVVLEVPHGLRMVWATSRQQLRRALACLGAPGVTCLLGTRRMAREVSRASGGHARPCHLVIWRHGRPEQDSSLDLRALTPAYAGAVREHYSHAEYLDDGELEEALAAGSVLGAFEAGRLVGFVGEHPEGSMGMLEVFEGHRRRGWGTALVRAQLARQLDEGHTPWAEVWPDNEASLALERAMGFTVLPADQMWFVS